MQIICLSLYAFSGTASQVTGLVYTGDVRASGVFSQGIASGLQMDEGAALTTGSFAFWNTNDQYEDSEFRYVSFGNLALQDYIGAPLTKDAAVLEFNILPPADHTQMELEVQFGSEEYIEYVGAHGYNDLFLVTVDGVVVSLLPDASGPIGVANIHPYIDHTQSIVLGQTDLPSINEYLYLDDSQIAGSPKVEYDGMTIRLRLHALITPLQTHKVQIIVCDVKDTRYDSALFIKSGSLRTVAP